MTETGPGWKTICSRCSASATSTPALAFDGRRVVSTGGFWAELVSFRLRGAPAGWEGGLVARVMPDPASRPRKQPSRPKWPPRDTRHRQCTSPAGLMTAWAGRSWSWTSPRAGRCSTGSAASERSPPCLDSPADCPRARRAMARLHRLDPAPVYALGSPPRWRRDWASETLISGFAASRGVVRPGDLVAAARWLQEHPPRSAPEVVCHGDLHPFNVLVDSGWNGHRPGLVRRPPRPRGLRRGLHRTGPRRAAHRGPVDSAPRGACRWSDPGAPIPSPTMPACPTSRLMLIRCGGTRESYASEHCPRSRSGSPPGLLTHGPGIPGWCPDQRSRPTSQH